MELAGHRCVGFCEYDKFAIASYTSMHLITPEQREYLLTLPLRQRQKEILKEEYRNGEWYASDIRTVTGTDLPKADCWCFGAPCQSFSVAGKRAGLEGESGLVREIFRLLDELKEEDRPEWVIYENVKGMFSSNKGWDYAAILAEMDRLGYDIQWQNINSKWFVPQNRERVYTVGHLRRFRRREVFPIERTGGENSVCQIGSIPGKSRNNPQPGRTYSIDGISPCLNTMGGGNREPQIGLPCFFDMNYGAGFKLTSEARTLQSRYNKGVCNRAGETSGVAIQIIGEVNSSQDGQVHDISGISKCHSAGHNNSPKVAIPIGGCYRGTSPGFNRGVYEGSCRTLKADNTNCVALGIIDRQGRIGKKVVPKDHCPTLRSQTHGNVPEVVMPVMNPDRVNKKQNGRRIKENGEPMFTLTAQDRHGVGVQVDTPTKRDRGIFVEMAEGYTVYAVWYEKYQCCIAIRKLTPKECFRLQGWSDDYFEKAAFVNSDSQLYKQAGNGVTVPVVQAVAEKLI